MGTQDELRREYIVFIKAWRKDIFMPFPRHLCDLRCGARTKSTGQPCKMKVLYDNGRCKLHGGLSTGAKTEQGKRQCAINGRNGGRPRKPKSMR